MIDATHLKAHWTPASLPERACFPTYRAHQERPPVMLLSESRMSDDKGAALMIEALHKAQDHVGRPGL